LFVENQKVGSQSRFTYDLEFFAEGTPQLSTTLQISTEPFLFRKMLFLSLPQLGFTSHALLIGESLRLSLTHERGCDSPLFRSPKKDSSETARQKKKKEKTTKKKRVMRNCKESFAAEVSLGRISHY
jgi:hypothetical protein